MLKTLTATTFAAAVALGSMTATPARADRDDVARAVVGIAALYAIGRAIDKSNDNRRHRKSTHDSGFRGRDGDFVRDRHLRDHGRFGVGHHDPHGFSHRRFRDRRHDRFRGGHGFRRGLPRHCLRQRWTRFGWEQFYSRRCLRRNGF